jgi:hypothetical protein
MSGHKKWEGGENKKKKEGKRKKGIQDDVECKRQKTDGKWDQCLMKRKPHEQEL